MDILRAAPGGAFEVVGKRCDRCKHEARAHRSLIEEFELYEFLRVQVNAGYGARYFSDGDRWTADLCERCVHELFAANLRLVSASL